MPTPIDKELYEQVKKKVKDRYNIKRSPFVSGAIVKEYKNQGGKYKNDKSENKLSLVYLRCSPIDIYLFSKTKFISILFQVFLATPLIQYLQ